MRRRDFITLLSGAATAWPLDALAQQAGKVWRMGFIAHRHESFYDALFEGLREDGYAEGGNLIVERRYARGQAERFKEFAAEMVRLNAASNHSQRVVRWFNGDRFRGTGSDQHFAV